MKNKNKKRNWETGDTFALEIRKSDYPEYIGKYLILIYYENKDYTLFRVKITKDKEIPTTQEEIEKLDYIKIGYHLKETIERWNDKPDGVEADEYGYFYWYFVEIVTSRKYKLSSLLKYIGRFDIAPPENEYVSSTGSFIGVPHTFWPDDSNEITKDWVKADEYLTRSYEYYNLQHSGIYEKEVMESQHAFVQMLNEEAKIIMDKCKNMK